jgi:23S rRNA (cytidine1920-2'-O)/16S rRNA (cytidine1409-2'-O)-methyltransferase
MAGDDDNDDDDDARRLDVELVRRGLMVSRAQAKAAIEAGKVRVGGVLASKPGQLVTPASAIEAEPAHPWVSRGALKLAHALDAFGIDPRDRICLDIGASTGGFTEVLLERGARKVVAVDVGHSQLHPKLRTDSRVIALESTDARDLTAELLGEAPDLVVCDASFIGLSKVLDRPLELAAQDAILVGLFKPQFEVGPAHVGKGGIVSDEAAVARSAAAFEAWLKSKGWPVDQWSQSPIAGADGNRERLFCSRKLPSGSVPGF